MPAPAHPSRNARWLLACLLCAIGGVIVGRQTRPPASASSAASPEASNRSALAPLAQPISARPLDAASRPSPAARRAALAALLRDFRPESEPMEIDSLMALSAWFGTADQKELAALTNVST